MASVSASDLDFFSRLSAKRDLQSAREFGIRSATPDGFDILVFCDDIGTRVCFGGLEHDFDTPQEAATWVKRALSDEYRLRVDLIGKLPCRWALEEIQSGGEVKEVLVSGHPISTRQRDKHRIIYRQNRGSAS